MSSKTEGTDTKPEPKRERNPKLRFPEFKDALEWEEKQLKKICQMQAGKFVSASEIQEKTGKDLFPCFGGNGLRGFTKTFTHNGIFPLIGRQGALCGNINLATGKFHATEHAVVATPVNIKWLFYELIRLNLNQYATGQAQPGLSVENLEKIIVQVPMDEKEQQKIADCLSSLEELITLQAQKLESLEVHKKGLMQQLFPSDGKIIPKLRFLEFQNINGWVKRELCKFITARIQPSNNTAVLFSLTIENGVTPKTERYERSFLVDNEESAYKMVFPNDFAYNPMNLRFGAIARYAGVVPVALSKYYDIFYCDETVDSRFCEIYFRSQNMVNFYDKMATGSLIEKRRVHFSDFLKFEILFPSLPEQQKIADCLSSLNDLITAQKQKLETLKTHKKGLMQQLFPTTLEERE
jgi:type I restriction enzyme, S subunit